MDNLFLLIGTTSINRPFLHKDNIKEWSDFFVKNNSFKIKWFINIDAIESIPFSWEETKKNYENIIDHSIEIIFLPN